MDKEFSFNYKEKFPLWLAGGLVASVILTGYCFLKGVSIAFKRLVILPYPISGIVLIIVSVLFIIAGIFKIRSIIISNNNKSPIKVGTHIFSFPKGKKVISVNYQDVNKLNFDEDDDKGKSIEIIVNNYEARYEIPAKGFSTTDDFNNFVSILKENCKNTEKNTAE